jgi:hypothetical protein
MRAALRHLMLACALALPQLPALATLPVEISLEQMVMQADHLLVGHVTGVDMVDDEGRVITDPEARTGPGLYKIIRLRVAVDEVLVTSARRVPAVLFIPVDRAMHYTLGLVQDAHKDDKAKRLVLLKGPDFQPVARGVYFAALDRKEEVLKLHKQRPARPLASE